MALRIDEDALPEKNMRARTQPEEPVVVPCFSSGFPTLPAPDQFGIDQIRCKGSGRPDRIGKHGYSLLCSPHPDYRPDGGPPPNRGSR